MTLQQILDARDARVAAQSGLLRRHPGAVLIVLTIVAPGRDKRTHESIVAANAAVSEVRNTFTQHITEENLRDLPTGYEGFWVIEGLSAAEVKARATDIEDMHPLGRLMDLDVMTIPGSPISRADTGTPPRKCLLCDNDARVCMRSAVHSYTEILTHIRQMVAEYERSL